MTAHWSIRQRAMGKGGAGEALSLGTDSLEDFLLSFHQMGERLRALTQASMPFSPPAPDIDDLQRALAAHYDARFDALTREVLRLEKRIGALLSAELAPLRQDVGTLKRNEHAALPAIVAALEKLAARHDSGRDEKESLAGPAEEEARHGPSPTPVEREGRDSAAVLSGQGMDFIAAARRAAQRKNGAQTAEDFAPTRWEHARKDPSPPVESGGRGMQGMVLWAMTFFIALFILVAGLFAGLYGSGVLRSLGDVATLGKTGSLETLARGDPLSSFIPEETRRHPVSWLPPLPSDRFVPLSALNEAGMPIPVSPLAFWGEFDKILPQTSGI